MYQINYNQYPNLDEIQTIPTFPLIIEITPDHELRNLIADLTPGTPWGDRQRAARRLGYKADSAALPALLEALPTDPFWMVRCEMILALQKIGDPKAIPTLQKVAKQDTFQVVRAYAAKAIERLTRS